MLDLKRLDTQFVIGVIQRGYQLPLSDMLTFLDIDLRDLTRGLEGCVVYPDEERLHANYAQPQGIHHLQERCFRGDAKALLQSHKYSIQEISWKLNFANQSFFGTWFKKAAGMSPRQYCAYFSV